MFVGWEGGGTGGYGTGGRHVHFVCFGASCAIGRSPRDNLLKARVRCAVLTGARARTLEGGGCALREKELGGGGGRETWGKQKFTKYLSFSLTCTNILFGEGGIITHNMSDGWLWSTQTTQAFKGKLWCTSRVVLEGKGDYCCCISEGHPRRVCFRFRMAITMMIIILPAWFCFRSRRPVVSERKATGGICACNGART